MAHKSGDRMMILTNIQLLRKSFKVWVVTVASIVLLIGCGGSGGGSPEGPEGGVGGETEPDTSAENTVPTALIASPTGMYFNEGENITFSGSATDEEDGELNGDSLVWTSSIDGEIGTGPTLITSTLTVGDHEITLTATDSEGGTHTTALAAPIHIEQTRFIKMGKQTSGVTDAPNAFDGDHETAATIMTPDTEFIHFKAFIGGADTFFFCIKLAISTPGSRLAIQGLTTNGTWQPVSDIYLDSDKTVTVKVMNAQRYKDAEEYINIRARWEGGGSEDTASIFEIWRIDPVYAGPLTQEVSDADLAFDGAPGTRAAITSPWDGSGNSPFLHFKAYVGAGTSDTFTFSISHNNIGADQLLAIDIEDPATQPPNNWIDLESLRLNTTNARTITVSNAQDYLDADGYISLRARWVGFGDANRMEIYEISRIDPFLVGSKTTLGTEWDYYPERAVDGNPQTRSALYYFWGEIDRYEFLHFQTYMGDASIAMFSIEAALSSGGIEADLVVEGEGEPDNWSVIERINIDDTIKKENIELLNARRFINSEGYLSLRVRWESDSGPHDAYVYEISRY